MPKKQSAKPDHLAIGGSDFLFKQRDQGKKRAPAITDIERQKMIQRVLVGMNN